MTKRARRRQFGLLAPRRPQRWRADASDYGRHRLDSTLEEVQPKIRPQPIDQPSKRADHELRRADLIADLEALIDAAMARSGALNTDDDPLKVLCDEAGLSLWEIEALAFHADGLTWEEVGKLQHVSEIAAALAGRSGEEKLERYLDATGASPPQSTE